jgi:hypothetical protein
MADTGPILVTGAAGQLGAVGRTVTGLLLERGLPVRALVRREDDRAAALRAAGAEVVIGDLLEPAEVLRVVRGCLRVYFGMSVSPGYLEASVTMAAVAREVGVDALVNMSQMTVSQMSLQNTTPSPQQRQHYPAGGRGPGEAMRVPPQVAEAGAAGPAPHTRRGPAGAGGRRAVPARHPRTGLPAPVACAPGKVASLRWAGKMPDACEALMSPL